ncbi:hypothetical protein BXT89_09605 [Halopseudomonas pachastrellae]|uniref:Uncharacterized protein n=1 Tax=Halopseudomonas pachastrellae TaxID=254161 RepID=A0A1S8DH88_9GAMM|nr:hypothetical protein [Halopseudomonas pachastrellae]ONM43992.1 hypothetical protein BXT89_09605 [Halopseudomonas pachastrellae]SFM81991.1 hypothetical protein SAMN05216256_12087 [Halopseudomonas pachastrellae]
MIKHSYISKRFDEAAILATLGKLAFTSDPELLEQDYAVLAALRRSSPEWDLSVPDTAERLASYGDSQIGGLVNNVKGILHEMEFQRLENEDGDSVVAALFPDTNHRTVDVQLLDEKTGDAWEVQLKATDDMSAIGAWIDSNPNAEVIVTEELSERMGLPSSGLSNEDLTMRVEDFVDRMVEIGDDAEDTLWNYFPPLVAASAGIIVFELWRRYRSGRITFEEFKALSFKTLGLKAAKYGATFAALAVPGLNVVVGAYLLGSLIFAVNGLVDRSPSFRPFSFLAAR